MKLLTQEIRKKLPELYMSGTEETGSLVYVKYFLPGTNWTWYATEGSYVDEDGYCDTDKKKVDFVFWGWVVGHEMELGYFSLKELEAVRGPLGLPVERDLYFKPVQLKEIEAMYQGT